MSSDYITLYLPLVLVLAAVVQPLAWRALAKGRLPTRCPACAYSLAGLRNNRCPECGQRPQEVAFGPVRMFPTRLSRRISLTLVGLAITICLVVQLAPAAVAKHMPPSTLWILRYVGAEELAGNEIVDRYLSGQIAEADYRHVSATLVMSDGQLPQVHGAILLACESALRGDSSLRELVVREVATSSQDELYFYLQIIGSGPVQGYDISWIVPSLGERLANEQTSWPGRLFPLLLEIGKDATTAAAAVTEMLSSEQEYVQYMASQLLAQRDLDNEVALRGFKRAISKGMMHRYDAIEALGRRGSYDERTRELLVTTSTESDPRMRRAAARALYDLVERDRSCTLHIILALGDSDAEVRTIAVQATIKYLRMDRTPGMSSGGDTLPRACTVILQALASDEPGQRLAGLIGARRVVGCSDEVRQEVRRISEMKIPGLSEEAKLTLDVLNASGGQ